MTALLEAQQALRLRMTEVGTALDRARTEAHQGELALVTAEKDLRRAEDQIQHAEKRRGAVERELEELGDAHRAAPAASTRPRASKLDGGRAATRGGRRPRSSTPRCSPPSGASASSASSRS